MKIMATFDETPFSESTLPLLAKMAEIPGAEFVLLAVSSDQTDKVTKQRARTGEGGGITQAGNAVILPTRVAEYAERRSQAIERREGELTDYMLRLARKLPAGANVTTQVSMSDDVASAIIQQAEHERPDVIVMATHARTGIARIRMGSVAEEVLRSGVAPVLLVHPSA